MLNHARDILVRGLPQIIQYRIPLYLPGERLVFRATDLILNFKHPLDLSYIDLKQTEKPYRALEVTLEDIQNPKVLKLQ